MNGCRFNAVAILDSVPEGEKNTGRHLREELRDHFQYEQPSNASEAQPRVLYFRIDNVDALKASVIELRREFRESGLAPVLHYEGHGYTNWTGLALTEEACLWPRLHEVITPLNIDMGLNLLLVLATCYGGGFALALLPDHRAPVFELVGPLGKVWPNDLEADFPAFYRPLFQSFSTADALSMLVGKDGTARYKLVNVEHFFLRCWAQYKNYHASDNRLRERALRIREKVMRSNPQLRDMTIEEMEQVVPREEDVENIMRSHEERYFSKCRDFHFLFDLYPENRMRFAVEYQDALDFAQAQSIDKREIDAD